MIIILSPFLKLFCTISFAIASSRCFWIARFIGLAPYSLSYPSFAMNFIALLSIFGLLAQYFTIEGLKNSEAVKVMPFDYSRIIFGCIIGVTFFNEQITAGMVFGLPGSSRTD